jgi:terpene synthase-like protein
MRLEQNVQVATSVALERIRANYFELLQSAPLSLQDLFNFDQFRLDDYCKEFNPHPQSNELKKNAEIFGRQYGVWLDNAKHHITCALFLYPTATFERMFTVMKNLIIDFYLNDVMGRDRYSHLAPEQQLHAGRLIERLVSADESLTISMDAGPIEVANVEALIEFRNSSPEGWFKRFLNLYNHHIDITHKDNNTNAQGNVPDIDQYIETRCHFAGMHHIVMWIEYSEGQFLEWDLLKKEGLYNSLSRFHWAAAAFGALSNDLFSFEKEVIDNGTDSNLVMIIALNHPELTLTEVISWAAGIVRKLLSECISLMNMIRERIKDTVLMPAALVRTLATHLEGLDRCIQASWLWQVYTKRYKRPQSIWEETCLVN